MRTPGSVCAVVARADALDGQTARPGEVVRAGNGARELTVAVRAAADTGATWLWIVDPAVRPAPTALAELLSVPDHDALGNPVLYSSKVVGPDGRMDLERPPWPRLLARELAMAGAENHLAALRAARYGSLLVHRRAVELHGPPREDFADVGDDLEWTGRVLRDEPGYLVPRSVVVRDDVAPVDVAQFTRNRVRILRGDGWRGQEKAWFAFLLGQELLERVGARPTVAPRLVGALARGLRDPA